MQKPSTPTLSESEQKDINTETIMNTINNGLNGIREVIVKNPKVVLGVALGVGILVGLMAGGKKETTSNGDNQ